MTMKLFDSDPYLNRCTATVTGCAALKDGHLITLDQTIFYPQGGGQPADQGTIDGVALLDVYEDKSGLVHLLPSPLTVGQTVSCVLDWENRFDAMQQHLGQHIFSRIAEDAFGAKTTAARIEPHVSHVELDKCLTRGELLALEDLVNQVIERNLPVTTGVYTQDEARELDLPAKAFTHERIRVVSITGLDDNPCGGTHPKTTGEVAGCVITGTKEVRGVFRIYYKFGGRAAADRQESLCCNLDLQDALGVFDRTDLLPKVQELQEKCTHQGQELNKLKAELEESNYQLMVANAQQKDGFLLYAATMADKHYLKPVIDRFVFTHEALVCLTNRIDDTLTVVITQSKSLSKVNAGALVREVLAQYPGKGGGGPTTAQCVVTYSQEAHEVIESMIKTAIASL